MSSPSGWLVCTAGLGSEDFRGAALRVAQEAMSLPGVSASIVITEQNLREFTPETLAAYSRYLNQKHPGFGYYTWKSEIVQSGLRGVFGNYLGVIWIDAGCEINKSFFAKLKFRKILRIALDAGAFTFALDTLEVSYTKRDLLNRYPSVDPQSKQIQATWFVLSGEIGRKIADEWHTETMKGINLTNDTKSRGGESSQFIASRHDQSLLSLVCKANEVFPTNYVPVAGRNGIPAQIRALSHPIWTSRNRKSESIKRLPLRLIGV